MDEREAQTWKASRRECAKSFRAVPLQDGGFDAFGRLFSLSCEKGCTETSLYVKGLDAPVVKKRHLPLIFLE